MFVTYWNSENKKGNWKPQKLGRKKTEKITLIRKRSLETFKITNS